MEVIIVETEEEKERRKIIEKLRENGHKVTYISSKKEASKIMSK
jgi:hypothetical protein